MENIIAEALLTENIERNQITKELIELFLKKNVTDMLADKLFMIVFRNHGDYILENFSKVAIRLEKHYFGSEVKYQSPLSKAMIHHFIFIKEEPVETSPPFVKICLFSSDLEEAEQYIRIEEVERAVLLIKSEDSNRGDKWTSWNSLRQRNPGLSEHPVDNGEEISKAEAELFLSMNDFK